MRIWGVRHSNAPGAELVAEPGAFEAELRDAYRRGRRDERRRHRRSPLITAGLVAVAAIGAVILFYAAREGSFAQGGHLVDARLAHVTGEVVPSAVNAAAGQTGSALQAAGQRLKDKGAALGAQASNPPTSN